MNPIIILISVIFVIAVIAIIIYVIHKNKKPKSNTNSSPTYKPVPPTKGPMPGPTKGPMPGPTKGPIPEPTKGPIPEPTKGPMPEPTKGPMPEPTQEPTQKPIPVKKSFMSHLNLDEFNNVGTWTPTCIDYFKLSMKDISNPNDQKTLDCLFNNVKTKPIKTKLIMPNTLFTDDEFTSTLNIFASLCGAQLDFSKLKPYVTPIIPLDCKDETWTDDCIQNLEKNILLVLSRFGVTENNINTLDCVSKMFRTTNNKPYYYFKMSHDEFVNYITKVYDNICKNRNM